MMKFLKNLFTKQQNVSVGKEFPAFTASIDSFYATLDIKNWWQGDVFSTSSFENKAALPKSDSIPYWMLVNRTCHLFQDQSGSRKCKLPYINLVAVSLLSEYVDWKGRDKKQIKNQISNLIKKEEKALFLPKKEDAGIVEPLIVNFNLICTLGADLMPSPDKKLVQLSSPFSEHSFQKFSLFFYSVGFDDSSVRSDGYIDSVTDYLFALNN